jgi:hypothetical protein
MSDHDGLESVITIGWNAQFCETSIDCSVLQGSQDRRSMKQN